MDQNTVRAYLRLLDENATEFTFQIYYPKGYSGSHIKPLHGSFDKLGVTLTGENSKGAHVSVAVNATNGKGHAETDIVRIRAVWQDDDKGYDGDFPLKPSLEVETSPGRFHRYWIIDPSEGEMSFEDFRAVMSVMVDTFKSDPSARDISRVMRLPGSLHNKGQPCLTKIVGGSGKRYPAEVIKARFLPDEYFADNDDYEVVMPPEMPLEDHDWDHAKVRDALSFLSSDDRNAWFRYGAAVWDACGGSAWGFRIWDEWCQTTNELNYSPSDQTKTWNDFARRSGRQNRVTVGSIFLEAIDNGWIPPRDSNTYAGDFDDDEESEAYLDFSNSKVDGDALPAAVIERVRNTFEGYRHSPSEGHWQGLHDISKVYHRMAAGVLPPSFYLSSLPCGMGKTTVATECTKSLLAWEHYQKAGVIYFLSRVEEIKTLVATMGLSDTDFAVLVSDDRRKDVPNRGLDNEPTKARVLFTTQQKLAFELKRVDTFAEISAFHYKGAPRQVRLWDETITPSESLTLERRGIGRLLTNLASNGYHALADRLEDWSRDLRDKETGDSVTVPDVNDDGIELEDFREMFKEPEDKDLAEALWRLSGRVVRTRKDNRNGATVLDYEETLPEDLAPMLILDASGGLRKTYSFWQRHRKGLVRLKSPVKTYAGLTIHHLDMGAGKSAYKDRKKMAEIAEGVAKAVNCEIPMGEEVLIIGHKQQLKAHPDFEKLVRAQLNPRAKPNFLTWGKHTATNQFANIKHVIIAGILQYADATYEAVARGSKKATVGDEFGEDDFQRTRFGEIAHNILQAACRGAVRKAENGDCPKGCHLYIIFPTDKRRGFSLAGLGRVFPEAPIITWQPIEKALTKRDRAALNFIRSAVAGDPRVQLKAPEIMSAIGITDRSNFSQMIADKSPLVQALEAEDFAVSRGKGRAGSSIYKKPAASIPLPF